MVSLGYMAKGFLDRNRERKAEEAQASAMDFKREQFAFQKQQHEDMLGIKKQEFKKRQNTELFKNMSAFIGHAKGNPSFQLPHQMYSPEVLTSAVSKGLVVTKNNQFFLNPNSAPVTNWALGNVDNIKKGKGAFDNFDFSSQLAIMKADPKYASLVKKVGQSEAFKRLGNEYRSSEKTTKLAENQTKLTEARKVAGTNGLGNLVSIQDKTGKVLGHLATSVLDFNKTNLGVENKNLNQAQKVYYTLKNIDSRLGGMTKELFNYVTPITLKGIVPQYRKILGMAIKNANDEERSQVATTADFPNISRILGVPKEETNSNSMEHVLLHTKEEFPELTVDMAKAAMAAGIIKRDEGIEAPTYNPKNPDDSKEAKVGYKIKREELKQFIVNYKKLKKAPKPRFSPELRITNQTTKQPEASPTPSNETDALIKSGISVLGELNRNPRGYAYIRDFQNIKSAFPELAQANNAQVTEFIKNRYGKDYNVLEKIGDATTSLDSEAATKNALEYYIAKDNLKRKNLGSSDYNRILTNIVDDAMEAKLYLERKFISPEEGSLENQILITNPLVKKEPAKGSPLARLKIANNGTEDKLLKFKPMLANFKSSRTRLGFFTDLLEGGDSANDPKVKEAIMSIAKMPHLLRTIEREDKALFRQLKEIGDKRVLTVSGDTFGTIETVVQKLRNFIKAPSYLRGILQPEGNNSVLGYINKIFGAGTLQAKNLNNVQDPSSNNNLSDEARERYKRVVMPAFIDMNKKVAAAQKEIDDVLNPGVSMAGFEMGEADAIQQARALARGEMMMLQISMTYYYAGMVQGESGGRAISNEDFQNIYKALWANGAGGKIEEGAIIQLEETVRGIERRVNGIKKYIGMGEGTKLIDDYVKMDRAKQQILIEQRQTELRKTQDARQAATQAADVLPMFTSREGKLLNAPERTASFISTGSLKNSFLLLDSERIPVGTKYQELKPEFKRKAINSILGGFERTGSTDKNGRQLSKASFDFLNSFETQKDGRPFKLMLGSRIQKYFNGEHTSEDAGYIVQFVKQIMEARR